MSNFGDPENWRMMDIDLTDDWSDYPEEGFNSLPRLIIDWSLIHVLCITTKHMPLHSLDILLNHSSPSLKTLRIDCSMADQEDVISTICSYRYPKLALLHIEVVGGLATENMKKSSDKNVIKLLKSMPRLIHLSLTNWDYLTGIGLRRIPKSLRYIYLQNCLRINYSVMENYFKGRKLTVSPVGLMHHIYTYDTVSSFCQNNGLEHYSSCYTFRDMKLVARIQIRVPENIGRLYADPAAAQLITVTLAKIAETQDSFRYQFLLNIVLFHIHGYCILDPIHSTNVFDQERLNALIRFARTLDCRALPDMNKYMFRYIVANCKRLRKVYFSNCPQMTFRAVRKAVAAKDHPFPLVIVLNDVAGRHGVNYKELNNNVTVRFRKPTNPAGHL